jgi:hypothetical protein
MEGLETPSRPRERRLVVQDILSRKTFVLGWRQPEERDVREEG